MCRSGTGSRDCVEATSLGVEGVLVLRPYITTGPTWRHPRLHLISPVMLDGVTREAADLQILLLWVDSLGS